MVVSPSVTPQVAIGRARLPCTTVIAATDDDTKKAQLILGYETWESRELSIDTFPSSWGNPHPSRVYIRAALCRAHSASSFTHYNPFKNNNIMSESYTIGRHDPILITGSNGFLGCKVVETLLKSGFSNLKCFVRPSGKLDRLNAVLRSHRESQVEGLQREPTFSRRLQASRRECPSGLPS